MKMYLDRPVPEETLDRSPSDRKVGRCTRRRPSIPGRRPPRRDRSSTRRKSPNSSRNTGGTRPSSRPPRPTLARAPAPRDADVRAAVPARLRPTTRAAVPARHAPFTHKGTGSRSGREAAPRPDCRLSVTGAATVARETERRAVGIDDRTRFHRIRISKKSNKLLKIFQ